MLYTGVLLLMTAVLEIIDLANSLRLYLDYISYDLKWLIAVMLCIASNVFNTVHGKILEWEQIGEWYAICHFLFKYFLLSSVVDIDAAHLPILILPLQNFPTYRNNFWIRIYFRSHWGHVSGHKVTPSRLVNHAVQYLWPYYEPCDIHSYVTYTIICIILMTGHIAMYIQGCGQNYKGHITIMCTNS